MFHHQEEVSQEFNRGIFTIATEPVGAGRNVYTSWINGHILHLHEISDIYCVIILHKITCFQKIYQPFLLYYHSKTYSYKLFSNYRDPDIYQLMN